MRILFRGTAWVAATGSSTVMVRAVIECLAHLLGVDYFFQVRIDLDSFTGPFIGQGMRRICIIQLRK